MIKNLNGTFKAIVAGIPAAILLVGCVAARLPPDARGVSFPERESSYIEEGVIMPLPTVRLIRPGLSKPEVRLHLGDPHFTEGVAFVQDWNYVLKVEMPDGTVQDCQYQVQFDDQNKVKATYWQAEVCAAAAVPLPTPKVAAANAAPAVKETPAVSAATMERWSETGLRFAFARSGIGDMRREDRERLAALVARAGEQAKVVHRTKVVHRIEVIGHADRIGTAERQRRLSLARARTVAQLFVDRGIDSGRVVIDGRGASEPVAECARTLTQAALIECLAPDRTVAVTVWLSGQ